MYMQLYALVADFHSLQVQTVGPQSAQPVAQPRAQAQGRSLLPPGHSLAAPGASQQLVCLSLPRTGGSTSTAQPAWQRLATSRLPSSSSSTSSLLRCACLLRELTLLLQLLLHGA